MKNALIGVSGLAIVLALILSYGLAWSKNKDQIAQLKLDLQTAQAQRDSIYQAVAIKDTRIVVLEGQVTEKEGAAEALRARVRQLENQRQSQQRDIRALRTIDSLSAKFRATYPEVEELVFVSEVQVEGIGLDYLLVPVWFSETFFLDHEDAQNYRAQRDLLQDVDGLQREVNTLQTEVIELEREKTLLFQQGYDKAFTLYETCNTDLRTQLAQPPRLQLLDSRSTALLSGAVGVALGFGASRLGN